MEVYVSKGVCIAALMCTCIAALMCTCIAALMCTCIAALMCTCIASTENEVVDEDKDVYLADISKIIPICGIIRFSDIKKFAGANAGVTLQLQKMLQLMERPVNDKGRRKIGALQF